MPAVETNGTRERCEAALQRPEVRAVADALRQGGVDADALVHTVRRIADGSDPDALARLRESAARAGAETGNAEVERLLLTDAALRALPRLPQLPVAPAVRRAFREAFELFAGEGEPLLARTRGGRNAFASLCRIAILERFPAGEFEWEVSGLPRSWLFKVPKRELPRLAWTLAAQMRGLAPVFFPHVGVVRPKRIMMVEEEVNRSYYRMAMSLPMQPEIRGLVTSSWFYSPEIGQISPHLEWMPRFFQQNGGLVTTMGPADPESSGVLARSRKRQQMYKNGELKPKLGLVIWPRAAMLCWAEAHPEYAN